MVCSAACMHSCTLYAFSNMPVCSVLQRLNTKIPAKALACHRRATAEPPPLLVALTSCEGLCMLMAHDQVITGLHGGTLSWGSWLGLKMKLTKEV